MKKEYMKPQLAVENFSLSQTIASSCGLILQGDKPNQSFVKACAFTSDEFGGLTLFSTAPCDFNKDQLDAICYNAPTALDAIFYS